MRLASFVFALAILELCPASRQAVAATTSASFAVTATVQATCQASSSAMGYKADAAAMKNAMSAVSVTCDHPTAYNVSLSAGVVPSDAAAIQKAAGPASDLLGHAILADFPRTLNGSRKAGTGTVAVTGNEYSQAHAGYAQTVETQSVAPGAHPDTITVTVTY